MMNNQPVGEYNSPCGSCPEYLNSCMPIVRNSFLIECDLCYCEWCSCYDDCMNGVLMMKLVNYDERTLILQNLRPVTKQVNNKYTKAQYRILCNLIRQKRITEPFFMLVVSSLYNVNDWKQLNYNQMYELIHILTFYDYTKVRL